MTVHDAQITSFTQWWKRAIRAGHAYAEGAWLHGRGLERHWVKESQSIWLWGLFLPLLALGMAWPTHGFSLLLLVCYPLLTYRIYRYMRQRVVSADAALYAVFCLLIKFPQLQGQLQFHFSKLLHRQHNLVEYKTVTRDMASCE